MTGSEDVESTASIPHVGRDPIVVAVRATGTHYDMIGPGATPDASRLVLPPDYAYLMDAPARIRAVAAKDRPLHVVTVEVSASRHVGIRRPVMDAGSVRDVLNLAGFAGSAPHGPNPLCARRRWLVGPLTARSASDLARVGACKACAQLRAPKRRS